MASKTLSAHGGPYGGLQITWFSYVSLEIDAVQILYWIWSGYDAAETHQCDAGN